MKWLAEYLKVANHLQKEVSLVMLSTSHHSVAIACLQRAQAEPVQLKRLVLVNVQNAREHGLCGA